MFLAVKTSLFYNITSVSRHGRRLPSCLLY
nr:MAG TPA: hypothetical protein [Caudoviricetes sp.]